MRRFKLLDGAPLCIGCPFFMNGPSPFHSDNAAQLTNAPDRVPGSTSSPFRVGAARLGPMTVNAISEINRLSALGRSASTICLFCGPLIVPPVGLRATRLLRWPLAGNAVVEIVQYFVELVRVPLAPLEIMLEIISFHCSQSCCGPRRYWPNDRCRKFKAVSFVGRPAIERKPVRCRGRS